MSDTQAIVDAFAAAVERAGRLVHQAQFAEAHAGELTPELGVDLERVRLEKAAALAGVASFAAAHQHTLLPELCKP